MSSGLVNTVQWYPWPFSFRRVHWSLAWITIGSLLVHLAAKAPRIAANWRRARVSTGGSASTVDRDRRSLLRGVAAAVGAVTVTIVGQSFTPLGRLDLLAPRHPDPGQQGLPINRTARAAGITHDSLRDWHLHVLGPRPLRLSMADLLALPQCEEELPMACVEGGSRSAHWGGVRIRDLLDRAGVHRGATVRVVSLQRHGGYRVSELGPT